ncbi:MAG: exonuclease SbcCD subunit D [Bacillaceae bacterium]|nr:exonuclease SbcCD subunit D [Bacillaceae bacterium]
MKFIHTADWHLGKLVHGIHMTEDQAEMLRQFVVVVEEEKPDAVIIAGDLYDRSVPPTAAVELLHHVLYTITTELNIPVLAISGNHDSAERIHFGHQLFQKSGLYIAGKVNEKPDPIQIKGVNFHLVPFAEPSTVRYLYDDSSIANHEDAMKRIVGEIEKTLNINEPNVLVGHAFVLGGLQSDSERTLSVGGSECVSADVFSPFHYTALGHLHSPDAIKHPTVRYSGSLMKYSFSEAKQNKSISIITMDETGKYDIKYRSLSPIRDIREIDGHLDMLLDPQFYTNQKVDDYLKVTIHDEGALLDPIGKLRAIYPNVLHLERKIDQVNEKRKNLIELDLRNSKSTMELFSEFYNEMTMSNFSEEKRELIENLIEKIEKDKRGACR